LLTETTGSAACRSATGATHAALRLTALVSDGGNAIEGAMIHRATTAAAATETTLLATDVEPTLLLTAEATALAVLKAALLLASVALAAFEATLATSVSLVRWHVVPAARVESHRLVDEVVHRAAQIVRHLLEKLPQVVAAVEAAQSFTVLVGHWICSTAQYDSGKAA
jgi:hypothetical protein